MKLYVANCTKKTFEFAYRLPEVSGVKVQTIGMGKQVAIPVDLNSIQIEEIIKQHRKYGLVPASEVDRTKPFIGYCYSVDAPVKAKNILAALEHNQDVLMAQGRQMRKEAAVAANNLIDSHLREAQSEATLENFEMTIIEEDRRDRDNGDLIQEGVTVSKSAPPEEVVSTKKMSSGRRSRQN